MLWVPFLTMGRTPLIFDEPVHRAVEKLLWVCCGFHFWLWDTNHWCLMNQSINQLRTCCECVVGSVCDYGTHDDASIWVFFNMKSCFRQSGSSVPAAHFPCVIIFLSKQASVKKKPAWWPCLLCYKEVPLYGLQCNLQWMAPRTSDHHLSCFFHDFLCFCVIVITIMCSFMCSSWTWQG